MPEPDRQPTPAQALMALRALWAMLLLSQFTLIAVAFIMRVKYILKVPPGYGPALTWLALGLLLVLAPLGYFVRNQVYKAHWRGEVITPMGYVLGNLWLLVMLQGVSFAALAAVLMKAAPLGPAMALGGAVGVQVVNFPHGRPMQPRGPVPSKPEG